MLFTACSPDDYSLGTASYEAADLVEGLAFTVTPDASDPNTIYLHSLLQGATPLWETPQGRSQKQDMTIQLPFAGEYSITFGAMTKAGPVYGEPYTFTVSSNNFAMLEDEIWSNLAGGVGKSRKWRPMNGDYGIGRCSGPVMYMSPDDVKNDGTGVTDVMFGSANWKPNWDPGFQSWLIPANDPYMDSYMELGLDATNGCTAVVYRNSASGATTMSGKFSLNVSDAKRPTITFDKCYSLHNEGFDDVCANYTVDIKILECTPYLLQLATMRTNSEGAWWIVWNFISDEAYQDPSIIPTEDAGLLETTPVTEPEYDNLAEKLFTISGSDATYIATKTSFTLNDEKPYDYMWWNPASAAWEWIEGYGSTWAPKYEGVDDFLLTFEKSNGAYKAELESAEGGASSAFTINGNKIVFADEITLLTAGNVSITGKEFMVMKINPDDSELVLGLADGTDETGAVNRYLCANLVIKGISGGEEGPTQLKFDASKVSFGVADSEARYNKIEAQIYHPWGGVTDCLEDNSKLKVKKNQSIYVTFRLEGITWKEGAQPRAHIDQNDFNPTYTDWTNESFSNSHNTYINKNGETTISMANGTGSTFSFLGVDCLGIGIEGKDMVEAPLTEDGLIDASQINLVVTAIYIQ